MSLQPWVESGLEVQEPAANRKGNAKTATTPDVNDSDLAK
jgi:hypothetical protein